MPLAYLGTPPVASDRQARPFSPAVRAGDFVHVSGQVPARTQRRACSSPGSSAIE